jgi:hypothetical protein
MTTTSAAPQDARLTKSWRFEHAGAIYLHLEGDAATVGFQHGYLAAPEIQDALAVVKLTNTHSTGRDWQFFRTAAHTVFWPRVDPEYQQELQGIVAGLKAHGIRDIDLDDITALNAMEEIADYYVPSLQKQHAQPAAPPKGHCSAFVATGSFTKDGKPVMAHSNWTNYMAGARWRMVFDLAPARGHRLIQDGYPGVIISDDDFGINDAGLMVTETTITQFAGFDPNGKPEFSRARKALQYATTIDDYVRIMLDGNNGGYANDWLLADASGEVARFELGLKHHKVWRTKDGYFEGSNFASDPELIRDETTGFDPNDLSSSMNARRARWNEVLKQNQGQIDVALAQRFLGDHFDSFAKKEGKNERSLCGHTDNSPRGVPQWDYAPFAPEGATNAQAADAAMVKQMSLAIVIGHPCGEDFIAADHLAAHPEWKWMTLLRDMKAYPWTVFRAGQRGPQ